MLRSHTGILVILLTILLTGFATSDCQGQAPEPLYTLRAEAVEVEALGQVEMRIFLDVHTPHDLSIPESRVAAIQFGLSHQAQLALVCVNKGAAFAANPGVFIMNSQDQMSVSCPLQDSDLNSFTPGPISPGEKDAIFALQAWDGTSTPVYFSGLDNELAVLTFESTGKAGAFPILFVGDLLGTLGPFLVTVTDEDGVDHSVDLPIGDPDVVTVDGQVLVRPSPVTDFTCFVEDECSCDVSMSWVNGEVYDTLKLYKTDTTSGNLVDPLVDPTSTTATTVQLDPMTTYLLVGTSNGVDSIAATCTIVSSCSIPDLESPVIVDTPQNSEVFASGTTCEALVTWTEPTATDNCAPAPTLSYAVTEGVTPVSLVRGGNWPVGVYLVTYSAQDANGNDATDTTFTVTVTCPALFIRGDANGNGTINIGDPYWLLLYLFNVGNSNPGDLSCKDAADANDDEVIDVSDAVFLYAALMGGGAPPSAPWPNCGEDLTGPPGSLGCDSYAGCP